MTTCAYSRPCAPRSPPLPPPWLASLLHSDGDLMLNPLVPIIETTRGLILHGELPVLRDLAAVALVGALSVQFGHAVFTSQYRRFADVL